MVKVNKKLRTAKAIDSLLDDENREVTALISITSSSDDEDANADIFMEIIKEAEFRASKNNLMDNGVSRIVAEVKDNERRKEKKKRKKLKEIKFAEAGIPPEIDSSFREFCGELFMEEGKLETDKTIEISDKSIELNSTEVSDNAVMRKLLRGPRYFDPPDNSWGACYNCGETGHIAANCTSSKRKKPCFICGSFEHNARQCSKGGVCYICRKQGHRAKDCSEKNKISKICLKCGDSGHDMFFCRNNYFSDDLKDVQCYICSEFGHLCCANYSDPGPREISCYRCGLTGHTGLACTGSRTNMNCPESDTLCYKCGAEGHFARECTNSKKATKRNHDLSTPRVKSSKNKVHMEGRSAPPAAKKKRIQYGEYTPAAKTKHRGGWISEDPGDILISKHKQSNWRSPATPINKGYNRSRSNNNYASSSGPLRKHIKPKYTDSASSRSEQYYQHRFSASHYGRSNNDSYGGNFSRW